MICGTGCSQKERLNIVASYHWIVTGNLDKEMEAEELGRQTYPRDGVWLNNLSVGYAGSLGQFEKAIELGNEGLPGSPSDGRSSQCGLSLLGVKSG